MSEHRIRPQTLTGQCEAQLAEAPILGCRLHREAIEPYEALAGDARAAGFDFAVASSFRSFDRQLLIWNEKAAGRRAVLDDAGRALDLATMDDWSAVQAILRWSALPGASRHHWGSDADVFDRSALSPAHPRPELTAAESRPGGVFHRFHCWLDEQLTQSADFYRPYAVDRGGVGPEPWHLSYRPLGAAFERALSPEVLAQVLSAADIAYRDTVLARLDEIHERFVVLPA